jgi:phosphate:Na+ symporter
MRQLSEALQRAAGDRMRVLLERLTGTLPKGLLVGVAVTALIQSSSATMVIVVGLVNAGLMTLVQAVGVVFGANIGTTITAQLVAFKLTDLALPAIGLGFTLSFFSRRRAPRRLGELLLGLGMLFLGMKIMAQYLGPVVREPWARDLMMTFSNHPLLGVALGAGLTAVVQSSSATAGLVIALAADGALSLEAALPVVLGANIGTCVTALLASIGSSLTARRTAVVHLLINVIGVFFILPFLRLFYLAVAHMGTDVPRQIANAHTLFNVLASVLLMPMAYRLVQLATWVVPGKADAYSPGPRYLDRRFLNTPALALSQARKEALRMGRYALDSLRMVFAGLMRSDASVNAHMVSNEQVINSLEHAIIEYLATLSTQQLSEEESREVANLILAVKDVERVGDHAESLSRLALEKAEDSIAFSEEAAGELRHMFSVVEQAMEGALWVMETGREDPAKQVQGLENELDVLERQLRAAHIRRLGDRVCTPAAGIVFLDIASHFERSGDHAANIGRLMARGEAG